ncbi:MAG: YCF48-related protein [Ignavibacteriaceae bacterium]|nr:YCF48-related protein [Ignavibacteriaceae bacterium]
MKKYLLVLLLISLSSFSNSQSDPNLKWLHPSPQGNNLRCVKMWDENNWYLAGEYGIFMKTSDAGNTWTTTNMAGYPDILYPYTLTNNHVYSQWFFDKNNGITGGGAGFGICKTSNGGVTFDTVRILNNSGNVTAFSFINNTTGFLAGSSVYHVQITTDAGLTWTQLPTPSGISGQNAIYASDASNIITFGSSGNISITNDAGNNWTVNNVGSNQQIEDAQFVNKDTGYVCGTAGLFRFTTDGGYSWQGSSPTNSNFLKMKVYNHEIYLAGDYDTLYKSTDLGTTWSKTVFSSPLQYVWLKGLIYGIDKFGSTIVLSGQYGSIYKSTDNGITWTFLNRNISYAAFIYSIYVENANGKIIAQGDDVGYPDEIIISKNGGKDWVQSSFIAKQTVHRMKMFDNLNGYFIGDNGFFGKTKDGAITVDTGSVWIGSQMELDNLEFRNSQLGWVVGGIPFAGAAAFIAKTSDGGTTWVNQTPTGLLNGLTSVAFVDDQIGYTGGYSGNFLKTTNGGTNWVSQSVPIPLGASILNVKAIDKSTVYINTENNLFRTLDGGTTWQEIILPTKISYMFGMQWLDYYNGIVCGTLGAILKTTDAGNSWTLMNTGGWTAYGITMLSPDTFYVGGGNGQVFRYAKSSPTPVELSSFMANTNGNNISITWSTASEKNNYGFELERGNNLNSFRQILFIKGSGTYTGKSSYSFLDKDLMPGTYYYRLKQTDLNGSFKYYYLGSEIQIGNPVSYELSQNYPNPFNPSTLIKYAIPNDGMVTLKVYDISGKEVAVLVNEDQKAGNYSVDFDAHHLSSGIYFYKIESGNYNSTKKLVLIK